MRKATKWLALLLVMAMCLNAFIFAGAEDGSAGDLPTNEPEQSAHASAQDEEETIAAPESEEDEDGEEARDKDEDESFGEDNASDEEDVPDADEVPVEDVEPGDDDAPSGDVEPGDDETIPELSLRIELAQAGQLYYGDTVTLMAIVENAEGAYTIRWEYYDAEASEAVKADVWVTCWLEEVYSFQLDERNAALTYRAVLNDAVAETYQLPEVLPRPEGDENDEPIGQEQETDQSMENGGDEEAELPELAPDRSIDIQIMWEGELHFGDACTLVATLTGYDNAIYSLQWQSSKDDVNWVDLEGETGETCVMVVTEENYLDYWRVLVNVTALVSDAAQDVE